MNRNSCPGHLFFIHKAGEHNFGAGMRSKYINSMWGFKAHGFEFKVVVICLALVLGIQFS